MTIKDTTKFGNWFFYMLDPFELKEIRVPTGNNPEHGIHQLVNRVIAQMSEFDKVTNGEYSKKARVRSAELSLTFEQYVLKLVHHQICLRNQHIPGFCYSNGIGDTIHELLSGVDKIVAKLPTALQNAATKIIKRITPSKSATLGGCSVCGGSRSFKPKEDNLGRAGKLNK